MKAHMCAAVATQALCNEYLRNSDQNRSSATYNLTGKSWRLYTSDASVELGMAGNASVSMGGAVIKGPWSHGGALESCGKLHITPLPAMLRPTSNMPVPAYMVRTSPRESRPWPLSAVPWW